MPHTAATAAPRVIHRADYRPPEWLVPEIALGFRLGLAETLVMATMTVRRNGDGATPPPLRLNGDGLEPRLVQVDGVTRNDWRMASGDLIIELDADVHEITIETAINPAANSQLMGLYASNGMLCSQCEAEGFRRMTFFPDRPDVLSTWKVRLEGDEAAFPVLLSNGNCLGAGRNGDGTHWAEWHDPWPKPSYLFALVAGNLVANTAHFTTMGGREVTLNIWVRPGDQARTGHALASLIAAMKWDEEAFGREYDLDLFNIVAVADFNMGAMENKGLNVFNTRYVLADPDTATDGDYDAIESIVGHEYFHNWSGNRVTCRDWFQLSLKEGFTVLRDQLFSEDMGSAPVVRIGDVRVLRSNQYPEDSGPLAHPIRPDSYSEINNFYTTTVYNKGAEVIRMMRTLAGPERFRQGSDLYFTRHDGEAATCEDFVKAIEDGAGLDLARFRLWYSQAGTPQVTAKLSHTGDTATLTLTQQVPPTPGQPEKQPMPIPLRCALFDRATGAHAGEQLLVLDSAEARFSFPAPSRPVLSINRGFSAPVALTTDQTSDDLVFLAAHDNDSFARYEAMQRLLVEHIVAAATGVSPATTRAQIGGAMRAILIDPALDDDMRGELMQLPSHPYLCEQLAIADPGAVHEAREGLKAWLGGELAAELAALHTRASAVAHADPAGKGARKVKNQALMLIAAADPAEAALRAAAQYDAADNMTDRQGALNVLCGLETPARAERLADFHTRYAHDAVVVDKWFALQVGSLHPQVLAQAAALAEHGEFTLANPNRVRALYMTLALNPHAFHDASGAGYRMIADLVLALDPLNAHTAARFIVPFYGWRRIEPVRSALMREQLARIAGAANLSPDTAEQVSKTLG